MRIKNKNAIKCNTRLLYTVSTKTSLTVPFKLNFYFKRFAFSFRNFLTKRTSSGVHLNAMKKPYSTEAPYWYHPPITGNARVKYPILQQTEVGHINKLSFRCDNIGCATRRCTGLCSNLVGMRPKGNYTHKPPRNSRYVLISTTDIDGNPQNQYFVYNDSVKEYKEDPTADADSGLKYNKKTDDYDPRT